MHRSLLLVALAVAPLTVACTTKTIGPPDVKRSDAGTEDDSDACAAACPAIDDYPQGCSEARCVDGACTYVARDADGDGFTALRCLSRTDGVLVETGADCDDGDEGVHPNAWDGPAGDGFDDACNDGVDQDCTGRIDDGQLQDGSTCICRTGDTGRCAETSAGALIDFPALDDDGDPVGACSMGARECLPNGTWGPCVGAVAPAAETCDGQDNDCDTIASVDDEDTPKTRFYCDRDNDGQLSSAVIPEGKSAPPAGTVIDPGAAAESSLGCEPQGECEGRWLTSTQAQFFDCDDADPRRYLGALEACDGLDTDCDGVLDGPDEDDDRDGYADDACAGDRALDCDDGDPYSYVGAEEICDGKDDDCMRDGQRRWSVVDASEPSEDADGDGHASPGAACSDSARGLPKDDCDDFDPRVYAGAPELCDGKDNDCDGVPDNYQGGQRRGEVCGLAQVAGGVDHACALRVDRSVVCWGDNGDQQLGRASVAARAAVRVPGIDDAVQVVAGGNFSCALHAEGTVSCWGASSIVSEQNEVAGFSTAVTPELGRVPGIEGATQITAGWGHACALVEGEVLCWGDATEGAVDGKTVGYTGSADRPKRSLLPVKVSEGLLMDVVQLDAGWGYTCAVTSSGAAHCWGYLDVVPPPLPPLTTADAPIVGTGAHEVAVGFRHVCYRRSDATVACWGDPSGGTLADYSDPSFTTTPHVIPGVENVVQLSAGPGRHTCARDEDGQLSCWGDFAAIGAPGGAGTAGVVQPGWYTMPFDQPLGPALDVTTGDGFSCALDAGGMWCWGRLGGRVDPLVTGIIDYGRLGSSAPVRMSQFARPVGIRIGDSVCFKMPSGDLSCMGGGSLSGDCPSGYCLGDLPRSSSADGCGCSWGPTAVSNRLVDDIAMGGGSYHCVVFDDGTVGCDGIAVYEPNDDPWARPPAIDDATAVATGLQHACALHADGRVTCWGLSDRLGSASSPAEPELPGVARELVAGESHTCVRLADGAVLCWGKNGNGQAGHSPTGTDVAVPTAVALPDAAIAIDAHADTSCAIVGSARSVFCWGRNSNQVFGTNAIASSATPLAVPLAGPAQAIAVSSDSACVLADDGRVLCWGGNASGQLGRDTTGLDSPTPTAVPDVSDAVDVACGSGKCCATRASGQAVCWGDVSAKCSGEVDAAATPVRELETSGMCCDFPTVEPSCGP